MICMLTSAACPASTEIPRQFLEKRTIRKMKMVSGLNDSPRPSCLTVSLSQPVPIRLSAVVWPIAPERLFGLCPSAAHRSVSRPMPCHLCGLAPPLPGSSS